MEMTQGEFLRDEGTRRARHASDPIWRARLEAAVVALALEHETFTAEDVRRIAGDPPSGPNAMGAMMNGLQRRGWIRQAGTTLAGRPSSHAGLIRTWRMGPECPTSPRNSPGGEEGSPPATEPAPHPEGRLKPSWKCSRCGALHTDLPDHQPTLAPWVVISRCPACHLVTKHTKETP